MGKSYFVGLLATFLISAGTALALGTSHPQWWALAALGGVFAGISLDMAQGEGYERGHHEGFRAASLWRRGH